jgi:NAD(P)-dependent dehydrogenase (short-subunit alcohol dehydrogenase family)
VVLVTGCGGAAGRAVVRRLLADGAVVAGVDANQAAIGGLRDSLPEGDAGRFHGEVVDLLDPDATAALAGRVVAEHGGLDGVVHLVGGWRGGKSFEDNSLADSDWLFALLLRTLQNVSLACHDTLLEAPAGRFVVVSATAVTAPTPGSASYAAAKAAAETWTFALAASFAAAAAGPPRAAATVLVVKALLSDEMKAAKPDALFPGYTAVDELADRIATLWDEDAAALNGARVVLAP